MLKLNYGATTVRAGGESSLVVAHVVGAVCATTARSIIGDSRLWSGDPMAQVVSYRNASICLDAATLFEAAVHAKPADTPTALVVPEERLQMFREYVQMHIQRGVLKAVFTDDGQAHQWAARQAQVREYWARLARSRQSGP